MVMISKQIDWTTIVKSIPLSTVITDTAFRIRELNSAAVTLLGYERPDQLVGRTLRELSNFIDLKGEFQSNRDIPAEQAHEIELHHPDGLLIPVVAYVSRNQTTQAHTNDFIWCFIDISPYKKSIKTLQTRFQESENANNSKSFFLAHISHGIRSQLNSIIGLCQLLRDKTPAQRLPREIDRYLKNIEFSSEQLQAFVISILELTAIEKGQLTEVQPTNFQLEPLIRSIYELFKDRAARKALWFTYEIGESLPFVINTDKRILIQILTNLVDNAIKFTGSGNAVELSVHSEQQFIVFTVRDEGVGMDESKLTRIFNLYDQLRENGLTGIEGVGLGLTVVKKLSDLIGGKISVESDPNHGSSFRLRLPLREESESPATVDPKIKQPTGFSSENRLLIIEDDTMNKEVYQAWFEEFSFNVYYADDGETGLKAARELSPNLIITDIHLPGIDGIAVIRELRKSKAFRTTPIIVISASTFTDKKEMAFKEGCSEYLAKPLDFHSFLIMLEKYLKIDVLNNEPSSYYAEIKRIPHTKQTELMHRLQSLIDTSIIRLERMVAEIAAIKKIFSEHGHEDTRFMDLIESSAFEGNETKLRDLVQQAISFYHHQIGKTLEH